MFQFWFKIFILEWALIYLRLVKCSLGYIDLFFSFKISWMFESRSIDAEEFCFVADVYIAQKYYSTVFKQTF